MSDYDPLFGGGKSASFDKKGRTYTGTVISTPRQVQQRDIMTKEPIFYKDGNPAMQTVIELQTDERDKDDPDDDGVRLVYAKKQMFAALRDAVRAAGLKNREQMVGATLSVKWADTKAVAGANDQKIYKVTIKPGSPPATGPAADDPFAV
jgi:hypothetical protein